MKRYLRISVKPLQQFVMRFEEERRHRKISFPVTKNSCYPLKLSRSHLSGPLTQNYFGKQYQCLEIQENGIISCKFPDNVVLLKNLDVVKVANFVILTMENKIRVIGKKFMDKFSFYVSPLPSSSIYEFLVSNLSCIESWDASDIYCKMLLIPASYPFENTFVAFPIIKELIRSILTD